MGASRAPVLIVGAGIGGLALAVALARAGLPVRLLERTPRLEEIGAGIQLSPNAGRALRRLGLDAQIDAAAVHPEGLALVSGVSGRDIVRLPLGVAEARWGAPYRVIHRADLQRVLAEAAGRLGVAVDLGADVTGVSFGADTAVAGLAGGRAVSGSALVGADGVRSIVAQALGAPAARPAGSSAWRAFAPAEALAPRRRRDVTAWLGPGGHLVCYPMRDGRLNLVAALPAAVAAEGWGVPGDRARLLSAFAGWNAALRGLASAAGAWTAWPLHERPAGFRGAGRATLIGDAAHAMLPHLAQGAAMAIEDAVALADHVAGGSGDIAAALRAYETARRDRVAAVLRRARESGRVYALDGMAASARDAALRLGGADALAAGLDWLYGSSGGGVRSGGAAA